MADNTMLEACQALASVHPVASGPPWWWAAFAAPMATAMFGMAVAWIAIAFERRKNINQELIKMAPKLNALFCFFLTVGRWKEFTPEKMLMHKRELDHDFHIYEPLFSNSFRSAYHAFVDACFETYTGSGKAARLRADLMRLKREWGTHWDPDWDNIIAASDNKTSNKDIKRLYFELMEQFAVEMGVQRRKSLAV
jgi:hypothetical protein